MSTIALEIDQILSHLPPEEACAAEQAIRAVLRLVKPAAMDAPTPPSHTLPADALDFEGRLKSIYGDRVLPDSKDIFDYLRADRC
jgi:hypothetical protein